MSEQQVFEFIISTVSNLTSQTDIYREGRKDPVEVLEFDHHGISIAVPLESCHEGHLISLEGTLYFDLADKSFSATGKIEDKISISDELEKIVIRFHSFDKTLWQSFFTGLSGRQDQMDQLFQAMKEEF